MDGVPNFSNSPILDILVVFYINKTSFVFEDNSNNPKQLFRLFRPFRIFRDIKPSIPKISEKIEIPENKMFFRPLRPFRILS